MSAKILVADDSLTIQKVIAITLANEPYDISECTDEKSLFELLKKDNFDLVLLDFSLSSDKSGYELASAVLEHSPKSSVLALLGTFDNVDDGQLRQSGIHGKIVKPFESSKFIETCRSLLAGESHEESNTESLSEDDPIESWVVDSPEPKSIEEIPVVEANDKDLATELEDWGMAVPGVIGEEVQTAESVFPPVIETEEAVMVEAVEEEETAVTPSSDDLEYPEPIVETETIQVIDEAKEVSAEDFWSVDEKSEDALHLELEEPEVEDSLDLTELDNEKPDVSFDEQVEDINEELAAKDVVEELKDSLRPIIEETVRQYCREHIEKVAWEVIPDLAENLIREEISKISESVRN